MLGGLAKIVIEKINWLVEHGYEVTLCNIERLDVVPAYPIDSRVKLVRGDIYTESGNAFTRLIEVLGAIKRVKSIIADENPDIIVNAQCPLVTWILPFVNRGIPKIVETHQSRQGLEVFNSQFMKPFARFLHRKSIGWIYGKYDRFVVLTNGDKETWNTSNCVVIPNFSSIKKVESTPEKRDSHQIIMIARISLQKRLDLMMRAWDKIAKDYPNWHVKVLGDGVLRSFYQELAEEHKVERFYMPGAVDNVEEELEKSDILCLTSEYEGFGIVLIEAMLKGVPVMAFEYVGVHDIIENGVDGYVVPFGDIDEYAAKLRSLMESPELRSQFAETALQNVKKFDKERVMGMWCKLFFTLNTKTL